MVSFGAAAVVPGYMLAQTTSPVSPGQPHPVRGEVDSFLAIHEDGTVTIFTSHVDIGTGINTVYRQIAAEELGIPVERFTVIQGDTGMTPNHGGTGGSLGVPRAGADIDGQPQPRAWRCSIERRHSYTARPRCSQSLQAK